MFLQYLILVFCIDFVYTLKSLNSISYSDSTSRLAEYGSTIVFPFLEYCICFVLVDFLLGGDRGRDTDPQSGIFLLDEFLEGGEGDCFYRFEGELFVKMGDSLPLSLGKLSRLELRDWSSFSRMISMSLMKVWALVKPAGWMLRRLLLGTGIR